MAAPRMTDDARVTRVAAVFDRHRRAHGTLCSASADVLGIPSAGVTLMGSHHNNPLCHSDDRSLALDDMQYSLGEGPSLDAFARHQTVLEPDLEHVIPARWPIFTAGALELGARGVFALPLSAGAKCVGVLTLYCEVAGDLTPDQRADGIVVTSELVRSILDTQSRHETDPLAADLDDVTSHRAEVHQASGMVAVQLGV
ncbi:MAG: GAF domain-containing protein, partial [Acidimicrobiia bacterium]